MTITLLLFASCREAVGDRERSIEIDSGASVGDLRRGLVSLVPVLAGISPSLSIAVNEEYATDERILKPGDEVALIPPVSGGSDDHVVITAEPIASDAHAWVVEPTDGAVVRFEGVVRNNAADQQTDHLEYEAYEPMARKVLSTIVAEAHDKWKIGTAAISHRIGRLSIGEISVLITVASPHRAEAFSACRYIIDRAKEIAPIWKKEFGPDGSFWVEGPPPPMAPSPQGS